MVSIIIISYNTSRLTLNCIRSIYNTYPEGEIVVVDNRSPDDTVQQIEREYPKVRVVVTPENKSYSNAVNIGMNATTSEYSIVCNADVEFFEKSIERLVGFLQTHPRVGVCSPQQQYPDGSWQYSYGSLPSIRVALTDMILWYGITDALKKWSYKRNQLFMQPRKVGYCDGAVLALRRSAYDEIGGFDENFTFYAEEADFCCRLHAHGWGVYFEPSATVMHIRGASSGAEMNLSERAIRKLVASKVQYLQKHSNAFHLYWFIRCEILNYDIKTILSTLLLVVRASQGLKAKHKMFKDLARFYREVR
jgi:GT2 family glycosyltransferase